MVLFSLKTCLKRGPFKTIRCNNPDLKKMNIPFKNCCFFVCHTFSILLNLLKGSCSQAVRQNGGEIHQRNHQYAGKRKMSMRQKQYCVVFFIRKKKFRNAKCYLNNVRINSLSCEPSYRFHGPKRDSEV